MRVHNEYRQSDKNIGIRNKNDLVEVKSTPSKLYFHLCEMLSDSSIVDCH